MPKNTNRLVKRGGESLDRMQFGDFVFPNNPRSITVTTANQLATHFCPGWGEVVQDLGRRARQVRCAGSFWGDSYQQAAAQLHQFRQRAERGGGSLFLPGMPPMQAQLRELGYELAGDGCILNYQMLFLEEIV